MKRFTRPFLILLALALVLSLLAGCGGKSQNTDQPDDPGKSGGKGGSDPTAPVSEEYVYVPQFVSLDYEFTNGLGGGRNMLYRDGKLLVCSYGILRDETPEGVEPEWEGQYAVYGYKLYWIDLDGHVEPLEGYAPMELPEPEQPEDADGAYPVQASSSNSYIQQLMLTPAGEIVTMEGVYRSWYDGPDDYELWTEEWYEAGYYE